MKSKYEFYEVVKVISSKPSLQKIRGVEAYIIGKAEEDDGSWGYAIALPDKAWSVRENDIETTGRFADPDNYKPVDTVRVRVLPDGSGKIINESI